VWSLRFEGIISGKYAGAYFDRTQNPDQRPTLSQRVSHHHRSSITANTPHPSLEMTTTLPPELIFHIVTFLQDDKAALSACSLCCSSLATVSRPLLFHTLHTNLEPRAADRFEGLLAYGPAVLPLIKRIDVAIPTLQPGGNQRAMIVIAWIVAHRQTQGIAPELIFATRPPRMSLFRFGRLFVPCLDSARPWVTSLELDQVDLKGEMDFWPVVLAFPNLTTLILGYVSIRSEMIHISSRGVPAISHLTLKKSALDGDCNVGWFLTHHHLPLPSLTSLDVRFPTRPDRGPSRLGEQYGATVRSLRFGVVIGRDLTMDWDKLACKLWATRLVYRTTLTSPISSHCRVHISIREPRGAHISGSLHTSWSCSTISRHI